VAAEEVVVFGGGPGGQGGVSGFGRVAGTRGGGGQGVGVAEGDGGEVLVDGRGLGIADAAAVGGDMVVEGKTHDCSLYMLFIRCGSG
jgi:hypothetical protein